MASAVREVLVDRLDVPDKHSAAAAARSTHTAADGPPARIRSSSLSTSSASASAPVEETATPPPSSPKLRSAVLYEVGRQFDPHAHWYPRALNAQLHPMVSAFLSLGNERIAERYQHLNPSVDAAKLLALLHFECKHFLWSGADLFNVTNARGERQMVVIETNSCPSGQKSMPPTNMEAEDDGYHTLMRVAHSTHSTQHTAHSTQHTAHGWRTESRGQQTGRRAASQTDGGDAHSDSHWLMLRPPHTRAGLRFSPCWLPDHLPPPHGALQLARRCEGKSSQQTDASHTALPPRHFSARCAELLSTQDSSTTRVVALLCLACRVRSPSSMTRSTEQPHTTRVNLQSSVHCCW